ncbi:MAG: hypothetical protein EHM48_03980 [Planctomycetaceae bacterium]|nr:MAG: hypothetical protein EHM48_03980 [Planctomycetaceae bacterium]
MKFWGSSCFVAGTDVLASSGGETVCKKIEDVQVGDLVWTRPEDDADAPLELRPVTAVYQNVVCELRRVTVTDSTGNVEELGVTTEHPIYSVTRGWVRAADLAIGEEITSADGRVMHVTANLVEAHPEGIVTYNFQVEEGHTYFVADGLGEESWIWVHNTCAGYNHFFPVSLGNKIPRGNTKFLTYMSEKAHTLFHEKLGKYLSKITKTVNGKKVSMLAQKGNAGKVVRKNFSSTRRVNALKKFFKGPGKQWEKQFRAELKEARIRGILK